jgi:prepilin-type N-terminal cleavage/methylation domain-containing protein
VTHSNGKRAFTLIEMMVTIAVLGIVMSLLAIIYVDMAETMRKNTSRANALETLTVVANRISTDIRNIAVNHGYMDKKVYRLVGLNGEGNNKFVNSLEKKHGNLSEPPNDLSDRLHFHGYTQNDSLQPSPSSSGDASDRVYYAHWINGEKSGNPKSELKNRYGILRRQVTHPQGKVGTGGRRNGELIPYMNGDPTPKLDLNQSSTIHTGAEVLGANIDYFSVRYFDGTNDVWRHCWDTANVKCNHPGDDGGKMPDVIQFAIRAYDRLANDEPNSDELITPIWYQTAISTKGLSN